MKIRSLSFLVCFSVGVVSSVSCGSDGGGSANAGDISAFCGDICTRANVCDSKQDVQTCTNNCKNDLAVVFPKLRADAVGLVSSCTTKKDCKTVLEGPDMVVGQCAEEARASLAPTSTAMGFCDAWETSAAKCSQTLNKATCLSLTKLYNDTTLTGARACTDKACAAVAGCINAALPSFGTDTTTPPPPPPATTCAGETAADACDECIFKMCCDLFTACTAPCQMLLVCAAPCQAGDTACFQQCAATYPTGVKPIQDLNAMCLQTKCAAACN